MFYFSENNPLATWIKFTNAEEISLSFFKEISFIKKDDTNNMLHYPVKSDVLIFLRHLVESVQPFAKAHSVVLSLVCDKKTLKLSYHPETIASDMLQLLCRIVTFTPQNHSVQLKVSLQEEGEEYYLKLLIENTGANLSRIGEITVRTRNPIIIHAEKEKRTTYEIQWHLEKSIDTITSLPSEVMHPPDNVRGFYAAVRNRMRVHFKKQENKMAKLAEQSPKEYIFLQKINAIIMSYMGDENFNVEKLAQSIAMSRMQLHRRLKPLVNQAPAQYIRDLRLIKAKEMIENSDLSIGDICFNVGFISQSHFTRVFVEKYGVRPLAYRKGK